MVTLDRYEQNLIRSSNSIEIILLVSVINMYGQTVPPHGTPTFFIPCM
jgi:hypothetical protein